MLARNSIIAHARLGDEEAALADCAKLLDEHWTPGIFDTPRGDKQEVTARIRVLAAAARRLLWRADDKEAIE